MLPLSLSWTEESDKILNSHYYIVFVSRGMVRANPNSSNNDTGHHNPSRDF